LSCGAKKIFKLEQKMSNKVFTALLLIISILACRPQNSNKREVLVGGPCEGCEAIHEYGDMRLSPTDTLPDFSETEPKLKITGIVYQNDGETPAQNVILYVYQTNRKGIYPKRGNEKGWARRHGYIRGWVKTAKDGEHLEKLINDKDTGVNNLDLDEDGKVDYIKVTEYGNDNSKGFSLTVEPSKGEEQEVATARIRDRATKIR